MFLAAGVVSTTSVTCVWKRVMKYLASRRDGDGKSHSVLLEFSANHNCQRLVMVFGWSSVSVSQLTVRFSNYCLCNAGDPQPGEPGRLFSLVRA